jgi:HEAT repeat protein
MNKMNKMSWIRTAALTSVCILASSVLILKMTIHAQSTPSGIASSEENPYDRQVNEQVEKLKDPSPSVRASAATSLGFLRAYSASGALVQALKDKAPEVRREAVMALAWCGGGPEVSTLLRAFDDVDWSVRQAAAVSLENLTGMDFPFDGLADAVTRGQQAARWRTWWAKASQEPNPPDVMALLGEKDLYKQVRGLRALGSIGNAAAVPKIVEILRPYIPQTEVQSVIGSWEVGLSAVLDDTGKQVAQNAIRSLGRLRAPEALPVLTGLLEEPQWARYAAEALGDFGSREAVAPLLAAYPRYARDAYRGIPPEVCAANDCIMGAADDRMFSTTYAMLMALARLPLDKTADIEALRKITPNIVAEMPADYDSGMIYQPEAWQLLTKYVLDKAGVRDQVCDAAFQALSETDKYFSASVLSAKSKIRLYRTVEAEEDTDWGLTERPPAPMPGRGRGGRGNRAAVKKEAMTIDQAFAKMATSATGDVPGMSSWLPCLCAERRYVSKLITLLDHENGWIVHNAVKSLMFANAKEAIEPIARKLAATHPEADYGYSGVQEQEPYSDPTPRSRAALIVALGYFQAKEHEDLLIRILEDNRNVQDMQYVAAQALDRIGSPDAVKALERAAENHPFQSVRLVAREAIWRRGIKVPDAGSPPVLPPVSVAEDTSHNPPTSYVFIRGENQVRSDVAAQAAVDPWRQTYSISNHNPTFREGRNLYILNVEGGQQKVTQLTHFDAGYVADCEVSWDAKKVIFAMRRSNEGHNYANMPYFAPKLQQTPLEGKDDPWWHIWEVNVDGTGLRQITHGPYHDVEPVYLPDGRILFSSSRMGLRDEYHMFMATGLTVMNADGSDIQVIGQNQGGDRDPSVLPDGRIAFARLDVFYSRLKTEVTLHTVYPDGTHNVALYGPERRQFWSEVNKRYAFWDMPTGYYSTGFGGVGDNRNRVLKLGQPQGLPDGRVVAVSDVGLFTFGPGSHEERLVPHDHRYAVTTPFPIGGEKVVAAASIMQYKIGGKILEAESPELLKLMESPTFRRDFTKAVNVDLGLYIIDLETGEMKLLYNDPNYAEFEPRPIVARTPPPILSDGHKTWSDGYTSRLFAISAFLSRHDFVRERGKLIRVIEGQPFIIRNESHMNVQQNPGNRWANHGGTVARVLGTVPLAADGSFYLEVPSDRLLQFQVLDSDRHVVGNETFWQYARPGETKGCVGCHEPQDTTVRSSSMPQASMVAPLSALPKGGEFVYRAKTWLKGAIPDETEDRLRTVQAINLIGRQ